MPQVAPLRPDEPKRVGRYRLTSRLAGSPGDAPGFLGRAADGDRVIVSLLPSDRAPDGAARDRFTAEARAARRVAPFCAARILDAGLDGTRAYLVSEYVTGPLLTEFVAADGPRRGSELEALATGMATGLAAIHQAGLVHGEFGPEYVVLGLEGPRVMGFGITPPYGTATPSADMLAWAQTVLFAATGRPVPDLADLAVLPDPLRAVVANCAAADPAVRPAARQVVTRLLGDDNPQAGVLAEGARRASRAGVRTNEPADGPGQAPPRPGRQRVKVIGWVAAAVVCVLAIVLAVRVLQTAGSSRGPAVTGVAANQPTHHHQKSSPAPPASGPAAPVPEATLPAAVGGNWTGSVQQNSGNITTNVTLEAGTGGGTISYQSPIVSCSGRLALKSASGSQLIMDQQIDNGTCQSGVVRLTREPNGTLQFSFRNASTVSASGTLSRA